MALVCPCSANSLWISDTGSPLSFAAPLDDSLSPVDLTGRFSFTYDGTAYSSFSVSSAGFIWLGGSNNSQFSVLGSQPGDALRYFNNAPGRIAPAWMYLDERAGGQILSNLITNPDGSKVFVVTYSNIPVVAGLSTVSFQVQLWDNTNDIVFSYQNFDSIPMDVNSSLVASNAIIGLTPPNGTNPQAVDLTSLTSGLPLETSNAVYDYLNGSTAFDLANNSIVFHPTVTGWQIGPDFQTADSPEPSTALLLALALALSPLLQKRFCRTKL